MYTQGDALGYYVGGVSMPAIAAGDAYYGAGGSIGGLVIIEISDDYVINTGIDLIWSWPSVANDVVYAACPGSPCAIDAHTSEYGILWWLGKKSSTPTYGVPHDHRQRGSLRRLQRLEGVRLGATRIAGAAITVKVTL